MADASEDDDGREARAKAVVEVLDEIGAGEVPHLHVMNKCDLLDIEDLDALRRQYPTAIFTSAISGEGLDELRDRLLATARARWDRVVLEVPYSRGDVISAIYSAGREVTQEAGPEGTLIRALMPPVDAARVRALAARERQ